MVNKSRAKELDRDMSEAKKHRKAITTAITNDVPEIKVPKDDVYANVIRSEEEEALSRDADKDAELCIQTCEQFKQILAEMTELKMLGTEQAAEQIHEKKIAGSFLLTVLKKLNRLDKVRVRHGRDELHKEKLSVDSNKLQLQNLLYEADHLRREEKQCLQFKSQDEEIDLVSEEQFFAEAPANISEPDVTRTDDHRRRLARLQWELHQRKELAVLCRELQEAKESVARDIEENTNRLDKLVPALGDVLNSTQSLQNSLGMHFEKEWAVNQKAILLPRPLYVAFINLSAYADVNSELIDVRVNGDEDEAKGLESIDKPLLVGDEKNLLDSVQDISDTSIDKELREIDDDDDDCENDGQHSTKKHHHRRQISNVTAEVDVFKPHPLSIAFKLVSDVENGPSVEISMSYLPLLRLITVQTKLCDFTVNGIATRLMRTRLQSRFQLYSQISAIENKTYNSLLPVNSLNHQLKITCVLAQWSPITYSEVLEKTMVINRFVDDDVITENHLMYHAVIIRGQAKMDCFVNVSPNYSAECPIWAISLNFHGDLNASNSSDIRDIEHWVNSINLTKGTAPMILVLQLKRAMSALDVFLDTESLRNGSATNDAKIDKTFLKIFRGRVRSRPYRAVQNSGSLIYTQI